MERGRGAGEQGPRAEVREDGGGERRRARCLIARRSGSAARGKGSGSAALALTDGGEQGAGRPQRRCGEGGGRRGKERAAPSRRRAPAGREGEDGAGRPGPGSPIRAPPAQPRL